MRNPLRRRLGPGLRTAAAGLVLLSALVGVSGLSCDGDASKAFRETATGPIGEGVKGIVNGLLDGAIAAIESAGDGDSGADDSGT